MNSLRFKVVSEAFAKEPVQVEHPAATTSEYFGCRVFGPKQMAKYLSKETYRAFLCVLRGEKPFNLDIAEQVAAGMKTWAIDLGATHYTHWFQPLTEGTAEKHDSFIEYEGLPGGTVIEEFSGKLLAQREADGSSFPNGGIRNTFEARGYTAWDTSSPAFVVDDTLCIPTVFVSYTGEALDYKTPLLRALHAVDEAATDVCHYFDPSVKKVYSYLGWEQEYFLIDEGLYAARPDLLLTGRTLIGHESAKNQQLSDHYFGAIPPRVQAFMKELEYEAYRYAIPCKTRHNEVAPNQFELAPIYGETNLAVDQNLLLMSLMHRVAARHGFRVLLHEKPFDGVNGSGKHNNFSLGTDNGIGLLTPGRTQEENLRFLTFLVNILMAVYKHNGLIKASVMTAGNANRLGGHEAPPAIISAFLGSQISAVLDRFASASYEEALVFDAARRMQLGLPHIPEVMLDNTDRNRTSPFAFTGNRFEFRAVGSSVGCGCTMIALTSAVAAQLKDFKQEVDSLINKGTDKEKAIVEVLQRYIRESSPIRFEGNGYSEEWRMEAQKRGLNCESSVPLCYDAYLSPSSIEMFAQTSVLSEAELRARNEVKWDTYTKKIQIEARVLGDITLGSILPVATRYQSMLLDNVYKMHQIYPKDKAEILAEPDSDTIEQIANHIAAAKTAVEAMVEERKKANVISDVRARAIAYHDNVLPFFSTIRYHVDHLELLVDDDLWPLPKYREMLFIN
ncbi:MAG: glutamine synthetase III [Bacteroidales bacterium]|nr:glutamine synthetase III [Bacteroidales bacterium]